MLLTNAPELLPFGLNIDTPLFWILRSKDRILGDIQVHNLQISSKVILHVFKKVVSKFKIGPMGFQTQMSSVVEISRDLSELGRRSFKGGSKSFG